jgi:hypothetical protein
MCIHAAHQTVEMMSKARERDLVATYGYMDGEHVFSATIVLVVVCAAFPHNDTSTRSMNTGLDLLRGMAERGWNSHMAARYGLLARLRSVFMPDATPTEPSDILALGGGLGHGHGQHRSRAVSDPWATMPSPMSEGLLAAQAALNIASPNIPSPSSMATATSPSGRTSVGNAAASESISSGASQRGTNPTNLFSAIDTNLIGEQGGTMDFSLWEDSFANPDAGYDFSSWQWQGT